MPFWRDLGGSVQELDAVTTAAVMSNGQVIFNVTGDIDVLNLQSECITPNGAALTTVQYNATPLVGAPASISGVSASLANAAAGNLLAIDGTALATAPNLYASGVGLAQTQRGILVPSGTLNLIVAVGPTTGTWRHYLRYRPMEPGASVTPAF